jgi:hypothetical protein
VYLKGQLFWICDIWSFNKQAANSNRRGSRSKARPTISYLVVTFFHGRHWQSYFFSSYLKEFAGPPRKILYLQHTQVGMYFFEKLNPEPFWSSSTFCGARSPCTYSCHMEPLLYRAKKVHHKPTTTTWCEVLGLRNMATVNTCVSVITYFWR